MTFPDSRVGGAEGWATILVVILLVVYNTGYNPRRTLYHFYRPETAPKQLEPWVMGIIWTAGLVLIAVAYVYFLTIEANSAWVDKLFPKEKYDYDVMAALILVNIFLIKSFPAFFCTMDWFNASMKAHPHSNGKKDAGVSPSSGASLGYSSSSSTSAKFDLNGTQYRGTLLGLSTPTSKHAHENDELTLEKFTEGYYMYHRDNFWVKWGTFFWSLAVFAFGLTIFAFFITKFSSDARHSDNYQVSTWCYFFAMIIQLFGLIYTIVMNWHTPVTGFNEEVIKARKQELMMS